ncbi:MAG: hypothetical protein ABI663_07040 [Chryseolinea sp.]
MQEHQKVDWSAFHTVEEMRQLSNLGHWIEGALFILIGVIALLQTVGVVKETRVTWQTIVLAAGLFLVSYLLLHHGFNNLPRIWSMVLKDSQQRQHLLIAVLLTVAGLLQIISKMKGMDLLQYGWPVALLLIGILFLVHEQHGSSDAVEWAQRIHRYLGLLLMLVSIAFTLDILLGHRHRWLALSWPVLITLCGLFLILYREPPGSYEDQKTSTPHHKSH